MGPEAKECDLDAAEGDGAEDSPHDGAEVFFEEFAKAVEEEGGEEEAGVGHGNGESEVGCLGIDYWDLSGVLDG